MLNICIPILDKPPKRYQLLLLLLSPWLVLTVLLQAFKAKSKRFALQRLGYGFESQHNSPIWIHCASVGEVAAASGLINALQVQFPAVPLVVSTTTATGAANVHRHNWSNVTHHYLPVDFRSAVRKVFDANTPCTLVLMETEIWPNLINEADRLNIPVVIVNARLSHRTLRAPQWLMPVYRQALLKLRSILCKSQKDAEGFLHLGASTEQIKTIGNIKFAMSAPNQHPPACDVVRRYWLAASTHDDEEVQLCEALKNYSHRLDCLLVIAPRHPHRSQKIQQSLAALGVDYVVRSKGQVIDDRTEVYLADQLGEMQMWLNHTDVVFMGGSMVPVGGHNLLEPAAAGAAIICGPYLSNVREEADALHGAQALLQADTAVEVVQHVDRLLSNSDLRHSMADAAKRIVSDQGDVLERYMHHLVPVISD